MFEKGSKKVQEVVFFVGDEGVCKEMMFTEFEAVLDGVVGLREFAHSAIQCAFAVVRPSLRLEAIVFFVVDFDEDGYPPMMWNVPFHALIQKTAKSSFGPFQAKVISRARCPVELSQESTWEPTEIDINHIVKAIGDNRLCLTTEEGYTQEQNFGAVSGGQITQPQVPGSHQPSVVSSSGQSLPDLVQEMAEKLAQVSDSNASQRGLDNELSETLNTLTSDLHAMTLRANDMERQNNVLRTKLEEARSEREGEFQSLLNEYEERAQTKVSDTQKALKEKYEKKLRDCEKDFKARFNAKLLELKKSAQIAEKNISEQSEQVQVLKERLTKQDQEMKEQLQHSEHHVQAIEKQKRAFEASEQTIKQLSDELAGFRKEKLRLMSQGADKFFERLEQSGLNFIAYHPGAGHVSVSVARVAEYLDNPKAFAAEKVGLSQEAYEHWLSHYESSCCNAPIIGGKVCGQKIQRHENPRDFSPGISDRCEKHRTGVSAIGRVFSS